MKRLVAFLVFLGLGASPLGDARAADTAAGAAEAHAGWLTDYDSALATARREQKPLVLDLWAKWCVACNELSKITFPDAQVQRLLDGFVLARIDMDAKENQHLWKDFRIGSLPQVYFVRPDGKHIDELTLSAFEEPAAFAKRLRRARKLLGLDESGAASAASQDSPNAGAATAAAKAAPAPKVAGAPSPDESELDEAWKQVGGASIARRPRANVRFATDHSRVAPGTTFYAGVHFWIAPGWHIYWKYPGDAGRPTRVDIRAPEGIEVGDLLWPVPHRHNERGVLTTLGYTREVVLQVPVEVPKDWNPARPIELRASVDWLVCEKNCLPGHAELTTRVEVGTPAIATPVATSMAQWRSRSPRPIEDVAKVSLSRPVDLGALPRGKSRLLDFVVSGSKGTHHLCLPSDETVFVPFTEAPLRVDIERAAVNPGDGKVRIAIPVRWADDAEPPWPKQVRVGGVLTLAVDDQPHLVEFSVPVSLPPPRTATSSLAGGGPEGVGPSIGAGGASVSEPPGSGGRTPVSFGWMLLFAFLGGILLNVMPCVLPVLSLKAMSIVQQAGEDRRTILRHALAYGAGVIVSFVALAVLVIALKASGELVGWGFQFQNPWFSAVLAAVVFAFALSMFGVYEIQAPGASMAYQASAREGLTGSFFNGAFATVLATPCTAPFLGPAMGFAFAQPAGLILVFFLVVGTGLALPFVLIGFFPGLIQKLPRGGAWMDHFKHVMGFLLMGTVVWLLSVLSHQVSTSALIGVLAFLTVVAFACWLYGRFGGLQATTTRQWTVLVTALVVVVAGGLAFVKLEPRRASIAAPSAGESNDDDHIAWEAFSPERIAEHQSACRTVFLDFTAAWCVTCKANEAAVIETDEVRRAIREMGIAPVRADYTNKDKTIAQWLRRFGRVGVPAYIVIPGGAPLAQAIILPELLSQSDVLDAFRKAEHFRAACASSHTQPTASPTSSAPSKEG